MRFGRKRTRRTAGAEFNDNAAGAHPLGDDLEAAHRHTLVTIAMPRDVRSETAAVYISGRRRR